MNYRNLLKKYIEYVYECQGDDYIPREEGVDRYGLSDVMFEEEIQELKELIKEIYCVVENKPCVSCNKELEPVNDSWHTYQPYGGCEIQIIGAFGSTKFDDSIHGTQFRGVICDDCAEKLIRNMDSD